MKSMYLHRFRFVMINILITYVLIADSQVITSQVSVPIGIVLDTNSPLGSMLLLCMQMALSDYYANHPNSTTVLNLHIRNAPTLVQAYFAVVDLVEREKVVGIIGPQGSTQDLFVSELGQTTQVPTISVTARSSSLSTKENNFFVRTTVDDSVQSRALAALCERLQWPKVVLLYEDSDYGNQFQSHLTNAFGDVEMELVHLTPIPSLANSNHLSKLLASLNQQETKVFLVHTSPSLGFRLFKVAKKVGMMREGNAWIITDSLSSFLSSMDSTTRDSMEGVVGVRPYVPFSKKLKSFQEWWERNSSSGASMDLNIYGLWAYDTIHALAVAAEKMEPNTPTSYNNEDIGRSDTTVRSSPSGSQLLKHLSNTRFRGLSGNFIVVNGGLKASDFEIVNLIGTGERRVGFWNRERGITTELSSNYWSSKRELKNVVWPGDSTIKPDGWAIPSAGSLRVGVPWRPGFKEFVDCEMNAATNETRAKGFAIDIFLYALKNMDIYINHTFSCYNVSTSPDGRYDTMLHHIPETYDMVVADTTIWAPRASYVDFSLPYSESGVVWVVKNNKPTSLWIFIKPFKGDLWLAFFVASIVMGIYIWVLERVSLAAQQQKQHDGLRIAFLVPVTAIVFPERALVDRKTSLVVLACWLLTAFILMQSYTANLASILTLDHLKLSLSGDHYFGYKNTSFTIDLLTKRLNISPRRLRPYSTIEEYHEAMNKGGKRGGIDAIFDELPYMRLFINKYGSRYKIIGRTYRTDGFGFAFPIGSKLVAYFSRAILNVTQGTMMSALEQKNFGVDYSSQNSMLGTENMSSQGASGLTFRNFQGLFIILGGFTTLVFGCDILYILKYKGNGGGSGGGGGDGGEGAPTAAAAAAADEGEGEGAPVGGGDGGEGAPAVAAAAAGDGGEGAPAGGGGGGEGASAAAAAAGGDGGEGAPTNGEGRQDINEGADGDNGGGDGGRGDIDRIDGEGAIANAEIEVVRRDRAE